MYKILIMGPQGSGKGTQAEILAKELRVPAISMGALLREEIASGSERGLLAKSFIDSGRLVPDNLALDIVSERLIKPDAVNGWILDGFPRVLSQAELFLKIFKPTHAILLEISDDQSVGRLSGRLQCENCRAGFQMSHVPPKVAGQCDRCSGNLARRSDDVPEIIRQRLGIYHKETELVVRLFEKMGILRQVDGSRSVEEVAMEIMRLFVA